MHHPRRDLAPQGLPRLPTSFRPCRARSLHRSIHLPCTDLAPQGLPYTFIVQTLQGKVSTLFHSPTLYRPCPARSPLHFHCTDLAGQGLYTVPFTYLVQTLPRKVSRLPTSYRPCPARSPINLKPPSYGII